MKGFESWTEAYGQLRKADQEQHLDPQDLITLALSAYLTGRDPECYDFMERAHRVYLQQGETGPAARSAFWLGLISMYAGERSRSNGWMARGKRILEARPQQQFAETGLLLIPQALGALNAGDTTKAEELFKRGGEIGEKFDDADLKVLSWLGQGQTLIENSRIREGLTLLDEVMVFLDSEEIFPVVTGIVYCAAIESCSHVWDIRRAQEWTAALTNWCKSQPDIVPFKGQCLARRAEIMQYHGEWGKALNEIEDACAWLERSNSNAAGEAYYRQGELHRLQGSYKASEDCYNEAAKWNRKPQPGLALLRLAQGETRKAVASIQNELDEMTDTKRRSDLLPSAVHILITGGELEAAREAAMELSAIAGPFDTPYLNSVSAYCAASILHSQGKFKQALQQLGDALKAFNTLHLPYENARIRELKGYVYRELGDEENAALELKAAAWTYKQLRAIPDLNRVEPLLKSTKVPYGLTLRELQILRQIASGKTNKTVARELFISRRTVDRHVSNIFNKLGVSSRVAASVFAFRNKLMDPPL